MPMLTVQKWKMESFFFSKVCMSVTQEVLKISQCPLKMWILTNFSFGIFIFKTLYGSFPEIKIKKIYIYIYKKVILKIPVYKALI